MSNDSIYKKFVAPVKKHWNDEARKWGVCSFKDCTYKFTTHNDRFVQHLNSEFMTKKNNESFVFWGCGHCNKKFFAKKGARKHAKSCTEAPQV